MHLLAHQLEKRIDELIPFLLAGLLAIIIAELFFMEQTHTHQYYIDLFDGVIITVFSLDIYFKYQRAKHLRPFLRKYWPDILAVIPFFMVFRVAEMFRFSGILRTGEQSLEHLGFTTQEMVLAREIGRVGRLSRTERMLRYFKILGRTPRFLKALPFFEKPTGTHHPSEKQGQ
jgi:hypothetical protein